MDQGTLRHLMLSGGISLVTTCSSYAALGPVFSLDDVAAIPPAGPGPITSVPGVIPNSGGSFGGYGTEDPYGLGIYGLPAFGGPFGPSPSLGFGATNPFFGGPVTPFEDADIIKPGPSIVPGTPLVPTGGVVIDVAQSATSTGVIPGPPTFSYIDAVSDNHWKSPAKASIYLAFSVDRATVGTAGTDVAIEAGFSQAPGDIFRTASTVPNPTLFAGSLGPGPGYVGAIGPAGGLSGVNFLTFDESHLGLDAGGGPGGIPPAITSGAFGAPIATGSHDNVDAVNFQDFDVMPVDAVPDPFLPPSTPPRDSYMSIAPDDPNSAFALAVGFQPADILYTPGGVTPSAATSAIFATSVSMGLDLVGGLGTDNINSLVVWEDPAGAIGFADPGLDVALFTLSSGSASRGAFGLTGSEIFITDFTGVFATFAFDFDLGLVGGVGAAAPGDGIDALEVMAAADANLDGTVDVLDLSILATNYGTFPGTLGWTMADFNNDGSVNVLDLSILASNYSLTTAPSVVVPESASILLLAIGATALLRRNNK